MLPSAIDPALLIYKEEHWRTQQKHFFDRLGALTLHRDFLRKYGQEIVTSDALSSILYQSFPWNAKINELQDLRQLLFEDWAKAKRLEPKSSGSVALEPDDLTCKFVNDPTALGTWKELLTCCVNEQETPEFDVQVATWEEDDSLDQVQWLTITVESERNYLPLVWDKESWGKQLASQDAWPNLHNCVELYFLSNPAMRNYVGVRENAMPFEYSPAFLGTVESIRDKHLQQALIKALAKRVYGVLDKGLGDEPFRDIRRFRDTLNNTLSCGIMKLSKSIPSEGADDRTADICGFGV